MGTGIVRLSGKVGRGTIPTSMSTNVSASSTLLPSVPPWGLEASSSFAYISNRFGEEKKREAPKSTISKNGSNPAALSVSFNMFIASFSVKPGYMHVLIMRTASTVPVLTARRSSTSPGGFRLLHFLCFAS